MLLLLLYYIVLVLSAAFKRILPPRSLDGLGAMDVAELPQAEAVPSRGVDIAVYGHDGAGGGNLKRLPDLDVHLKVGDGAPVVRS